MKRLFIILTICSATATGHAQDSQQSVVTPWKSTAEPFWNVGIGYPQALSGGVMAVIGERRRTHRFGGQLRGIVLACEPGVSGLSARAGWASLAPYDAGIGGFSIEGVYLRPWLLPWAFKANDNYLGPGGTYHLGYLKLSGGILTNLNGPSRQVRPTITVGLVIPFR
jgi:hypothetical protein